jgi:hypothetical protein
MNATDLKALEPQTTQTLAEWWCLLNRWGWPTKLRNPEERELGEPIANTRRWEIMCWIADKIGEKECSREWNKDTMGDAEHEAWWRKHGRNVCGSKA